MHGLTADRYLLLQSKEATRGLTYLVQLELMYLNKLAQFRDLIPAFSYIGFEVSKHLGTPKNH